MSRLPSIRRGRSTTRRRRTTRGRRTTRRSNPLQVSKRPNVHSAHGPTPRNGPSEASSQLADRSLPRPRPPAARHISASPEGRRPTLGEPTDSASFEAPSTEPPAGPRFEGKLRLGRDYPSIDGDCNPPAQQTRAFNANHSTVGRGSQTASVTMPHSGHDRSPVRQLRPLYHYSRRCANLRRAMRTCLTLHPPLCCQLYVLPPMQDPRRVW